MTSHRRILQVAVAALFGLMTAQTANAQRVGGKPGLAGPAAPPRPAAPTGPTGAGSGDVMRIVKFIVADEAKEPDLIGTLTLQPFRKGAKSVKVRILKHEDAKISIGTVSFTPDRYPEILNKGLQCSVAWTLENEKPTAPKNMTTIGFQPISVIGVVDKIEGDVITLKRALPSDGRNWPDEELANMPAPAPPPKPMPTGNGNRNTPPPRATTPPRPQNKKVKPRTIKVKAMEELSKLTDENNQEIAAGDIPVGTKVEVAVILSNATGIATTLAYTNANAVVNKDGPRPTPQRPPAGGGPAGGG